MESKSFESKGKRFSSVVLNSKDDYAVWSFTIKQHLKTAGLLSYIEQRDTEDTKSDANADEVKSILLSVLSPREINKILHCNTAAEIWSHFESSYGKDSSNTKLDLMNELNSIRCSSVTDVENMVNKVLQLKGKLKNLDVVLDDQMVISTVIKAVPKPAFDSFLESWLMLDVDQQTLNKFTEKILDKAKALANSDQYDNAMVAHQQLRPQYRPRIPFQSRISYQHRLPSYQPRAPYQPRFPYRTPVQPNTVGFSNNPTSDQTGRVTCNYCKKIGHWKEDCFKLKRMSSFPPNDQSHHQGEETTTPDTSYVAEDISFMAVENSIDNVKSLWLADTGSSNHMTSTRDWLDNYVLFSQPRQIKIGERGRLVEALGIGMIRTTSGKITDVYFVPKLGANLFSIAQAEDNGLVGLIKDRKIRLFYEEREVLVAERYGRVYLINFTIMMPHSALTATTIERWHERFGHLSKRLIRKMADDNAVDGIKIKTDDEKICSDCQANKCTRVSHALCTTPKSTSAGQCLHADVIGPIKPEGLQGQRFILVCKDEMSGLRMVSCLRAKSDVPEIMKAMINKAETQTGRYCNKLSTDNGSEFLSERLTIFLSQRGIEHCLSVRYTPQQNGVIERENRVLIEQARTLLNKSKLDLNLWPEAISCATYTSNRSITTQRHKTPLELWCGRKPNVDNLKIFGQQAVVLTPEHLCGKFSEKGKLMNFVSYTEKFNTYKFYSALENRLIISCDARFLPSVGPITKDSNENNSPATAPMVGLHLQQTNNTDADRETPLNSAADLVIDKEPEPQNASPNAAAYDFDNEEPPAANLTNETIEESNERSNTTQELDESLEEHDVTIVNKSASEGNLVGVNEDEQVEDTSEGRILRNIPKPDYKAISKGGWDLSANVAQEEAPLLPRTFQEAMDCTDSTNWLEAANDEMKSMLTNQVFELVERPKCNVVGSRWVFTLKDSPDGGVKFKARLVAKGFTQKYGLDYFNTFAPVVQMDLVRFLFATAALKRLKITQIDIKTAFLNGYLKEDIYMEQPCGYHDGSNKVWKLKKSIYGLKQAPKAWYERFTQHLTGINLKASNVDPCVFYQNKPLIIIAVYVDDALIFSEHYDNTQKVISHLKKEFEVNVLKAKKFIGFQYELLSNGDIYLHQTDYINSIIERYGFSESNPVSVPFHPCNKTGDLTPLGDNILFREKVGCLQYAAVQTRPDISYTVGFLGRKVLKPTALDNVILNQCLRYLKGNNYGILYKAAGSEMITTFSDADLAGDNEKRRSTTGFVSIIADGPISWKSKLQRMAVTSTAEAEFLAVASLIKSIMPLRTLGIQLGTLSKKPTPILCDNSAAVNITTNQVSAQRTKHLGAHLSFAQDAQSKKIIDISHIPGSEQTADLFTKPLIERTFTNLRSKLMAFTMLSMLCIVNSTPAQDFSPTVQELDNLVTLIPTSHKVQYGTARVTFSYPFEHQCRPLLEYLRNHKNETNARNVMIKLKNDCVQFRDEKLIRYAQSLSTYRVKREDVSLPPKLNLEEDAPTEKESETSFWASVFLPPVRDIVQHYDKNSAENTAVKNAGRLNQISKAVNQMHGQVYKVISVNNKNIENIELMSSSLNDTIKKQDQLYEILAEAIRMGAQAFDDIQRDADEIRDLTVDATKKKVNARILKRIYSTNITDMIDTDLDELELLAITANRDMLSLEVNIPLINSNITVLETFAFKEWIDEKTYRATSDNYHVVHNVVNNCTKYVAKPTSQVFHQSCDKANSSLKEPTFEWKTYEVSDNPIKAKDPVLVKSHQFILVQCFLNQIIIGNEVINCGKQPYILPQTLSFRLEEYHHTYIEKEFTLDKTNPMIYNATYTLMKNPWDTTRKRIAENVANSTKENQELLEMNVAIAIQSGLRLAKENPLEAGTLAAVPLIIVCAWVSVWLCREKKDPLVNLMEKQLMVTMGDQLARLGKGKSTPNLKFSLEDANKTDIIKYPSLYGLYPAEAGLFKRRQELYRCRPCTPGPKSKTELIFNEEDSDPSRSITWDV